MFDVAVFSYILYNIAKPKHFYAFLDIGEFWMNYCFKTSLNVGGNARSQRAVSR